MIIIIIIIIIIDNDDDHNHQDDDDNDNNNSNYNNEVFLAANYPIKSKYFAVFFFHQLRRRGRKRCSVLCELSCRDKEFFFWDFFDVDY